MKKSEPVSFIVPVFNGAETLRESVLSIVSGNLLPGDEILIIDDGSTDQSLKEVEGLADENSAIRVVRHNSNKGSANAARNTGGDFSANEIFSI